MTRSIPPGANTFARRCLPVLMFLGCSSSPATYQDAGDGCVVPGYTLVATLMLPPIRKDDLVFVIDNSPSMAPKREKFMKQLPELLDALKDQSGTLPNLRVAILDGDMGSSGAISTGACGAKNGTTLGDAGQLQIVGGLTCGMTDPNARWLQMLTLSPANYSGDIVQVFTCLAGGLGQAGCEYQQPLQALATAATPGSASLSEFVRPEAYLDLVIISDQDDCSAFPNTGMFAPGVPTETTGLRCATRGYSCGGANLDYPTTASYAHPLNDCLARTDVCPSATDTSRPTGCTPFADVHALAEQVKALKPGHSDETIMVTAIAGWPLSDAKMLNAEYKIAPIPNPGHLTDASAPATIYDLWPVCYDADHPPTNPDPTTGFDAEAAGYGATPSLRLSAFVDEFGPNGLKFSMCEADWTDAMGMFGETLTREMRNLCVDQKLVDADPSTPELDPDCILEYDAPNAEIVPTPPGCAICAGSACADKLDSGSQWTRTYLPRCDPNSPVPPCWELTQNWTKCPVNGQFINVHRTPARYTPGGDRYRLQCRVCPSADAGTATLPGCNT
jgi:hypothetical protein